MAHADGSAAWLARQGYPELGPAIVGHPITRLADGEWFDRWLGSAGPEALIVAYADKRAGQRLESMAERFASWERRYAPGKGAARTGSLWEAETLGAIRHRAAELERLVCELAHAAPDEVRRLEWTGPAFAAARAAAAAGARR
jgi:hypothetical protein